MNPDEAEVFRALEGMDGEPFTDLKRYLEKTKTKKPKRYAEIMEVFFYAKANGPAKLENTLTIAANALQTEGKL